MSKSVKMTVVSTPSQDLALSNLAYCSSMDLPKFTAPGSRLAYALVGGDFVVYTLGYPFSPLHSIA